MNGFSTKIPVGSEIFAAEKSPWKTSFLSMRALLSGCILGKDKEEAAIQAGKLPNMAQTMACAVPTPSGEQPPKAGATEWNAHKSPGKWGMNIDWNKY